MSYFSDSWHDRDEVVTQDFSRKINPRPVSLDKKHDCRDIDLELFDYLVRSGTKEEIEYALCFGYHSTKTFDAHVEDKVLRKEYTCFGITGKRLQGLSYELYCGSRIIKVIGDKVEIINKVA